MTRIAVGIDIGGTKIAAGIVDVKDGRILVSRHCPTCPRRGGEAVLADCIALTTDLLAERNQVRQTAIGIGVPELVDPTGTVQSAFQFDWRALDIQDAFSHLGTVHLESDVRAGALAEATLGAAARWSSALYVSIGTGISSCFVIDGKPWRGTHGNALVLATGPTMVVDPASGQVVTNVLEATSSGPALVERFRASGGKSTTASTEEVLRLAESGDPIALHVATTGAQVLGNAIGQAVNVLDPAVVVLGGGLGSTEGLYRHHLDAAMRATIWSDASRDIPLRTSHFGANAGLVGAALAASADARLPEGVPC